MKTGLVSVVTACYNAENYLERYMRSIVNQTYKNVELIIVNDGSTDKSGEIVKKMKSKFKKAGKILKVVEQKNRGMGAAVDIGLKYVEGEFLVWADSDDYYELDAFEKMTEFLNNNKDYNTVRGKCAFVNDKEEIIEIRGSKNPDNTSLFMNYIIEDDVYSFTGIFMTRSEKYFINNNGNNIFKSRAGQNWQMILPSVYKEKTGYLDRIVLNYYFRDNSHSRAKLSSFGVLKRMENHKKILRNTVKKIVKDRKERATYFKIIRKKYFKREKDFIIYTLKHRQG